MGPLQHIYRLVPSALPGDLTTWLCLPCLLCGRTTGPRRRGGGWGAAEGSGLPQTGPKALPMARMVHCPSVLLSVTPQAWKKFLQYRLYRLVQPSPV